MLSFDERVKHILLKIRRADEHLQELEQQLGVFFEKEPYKIDVKIDEHSRKPVYFVASVEPVPDHISLLAGDVIQNLVTALDHLAYQLVCKDTNDAPPQPNAIYFPIASDFDKYEKTKLRKLKGATKATINAVDQIRPYKDGNDLIWSLHALNNIEKHRLLLTVGSQAAGVELFHMMSDFMKDVFPQEAMNAFQSMGIFINPADKGFPLTEGFELYVGSTNEKPKADMRFRFDVGLKEVGILEEISLLKKLKEFKVEVERVVDELMPLLK